MTRDMVLAWPDHFQVLTSNFGWRLMGSEVLPCCCRPEYVAVSHVGRHASMTWRCRKRDGAMTFAKFTTDPYPWKLHKEASKVGVAPELVFQESLPGSQYLAEMEFLDQSATGAHRQHRTLLDAALQSFQACGNGKAVHGDLRPPNIFVRWVDTRVNPHWGW